MREKKCRMEAYSFYDHTGISTHLEKMAEKGWMLEKIANYGWIYRRIEPKKVHFAVSYYPNASEFDPEPLEEQKMLHELCAEKGWKLACTSAQMQIFYNENENPMLLETKPELELEAIHESAKKSFLPSYFLLLGISILQGAMFVSSLLGDPIELLSNSTRLFTGVAFFDLFLLCSVELICYFTWHKKAKQAAEQGEFLEVPSTTKFQKGVVGVVCLGALYWAINFILGGTKLQRWIGISMFFYMLLLVFIVNSVKEFLKRKNTSRGLNRAVTIFSSFAAAFGMMFLITFVMLKASAGGLMAERGEETYEYNGTTWVIHQDELPFTIEDLLDIEFEGYIKERRETESLFLGQMRTWQRPRFDVEDYVNIPQLAYRIVVVKLPVLYELCKERMIYEEEHPHSIIKERTYQPEDEKTWGAKEVYRLYDPEYGAKNDYLLCYEDMLVEISFDWEPTTEQMKIVGEKLNRKEKKL